jgi:hypothetical protein
MKKFLKDSQDLTFNLAGDGEGYKGILESFPSVYFILSFRIL